jgi:glucose-6-phosphate isomerase
MSKQFKNLPIALDCKYLKPWITPDAIKSRADIIAFADQRLRSGECPGAEFTGWIKPDGILASEEILRLKAAAKRLAEETDVLVVIGIGGSYLGARAAIEALADDPDKVVYAGQNISAHYITRLRKSLKGKRVAINVVSKSGTTTEPAVALRILKDLVPEDVASKHIVATTDEKKGALLSLANANGWETFVVPDDIGGRYSVLSAVGLLPIAYAGVDIDAFVKGAVDCAKLIAADPNPLHNPAYFYVLARNILLGQGYGIELMSSFEPRLHYMAEWWKQLYGESEGKDNLGMFPASVDFTTDLHSLGQYVQEGRRVIAETFLIVDEGEPSITVPKWDEDTDGMNYLAGREMSYVNSKAYEATAQAHYEGSVPNMTIHLENLDARSLGSLMYFHEIACAVSGLVLGVNPFNQPGVEAYKKHMFTLLGKPGATTEGAATPDPEYISF